MPVIAESRKQVLTAPSKREDNNIAVKNTSRNEKPANPIQVLSKKEEPVVVVNNDNKPSNNLPKPVNDPNLNKNASNPGVAIVNSPKETNNQLTPLPKDPVTTHPASPLYASEDVADLNQSEKKGKLRGFFRKVTRTFEKRTNIDPADDDKLLVGGLAFKLK